ncbi:MAG: hypothetical protein U1E93_03560 [Alphaproteobacteria bacterium]
MSPARYLSLLVLTVLTLAGFWSAFAWTQRGRFTPSSFAQCHYIERKVQLGTKVPSPKIVVVAGSGATMGISAAKLSQAFDVSAYNMGLLGYYSPGLQLFEARKILHPGDAVILAHEFLAYYYDTPSDNMIDAVYACAGDYLDTLPMVQRVAYAFYVTPWRYIQVRNFDPAKLNLAADNVSRITNLGDADVERLPPRSESDLQTIHNFEPLPISLRPDSAGAVGISDFLLWAAANDIAVFPTWPNTIDFPAYHNNPGLAAIERFYSTHGVPMVGRLSDSVFPSSMFYDSDYHLGRQGIDMRTATLIQNLRRTSRFKAWLQRAGGAPPAR